MSTSGPNPWRVFSVAKLLRNPPSPPPELIDGFLRKRDRAVLAAPRSSGKSWFVMQLAEQLARGAGDFLGFPVNQPSNVLIVHGETTSAFSAQRWQMLTGGDAPQGLFETYGPYGVEVIERRVSHWDHDAKETISDRIYHTRWHGDLELLIDGLEIDVLIIDPWATFFRGDENSNNETEQALAHIAALQQKYGLTVVIVHHFGKQFGKQRGSETEDSWRGASRLADWASLRITLTPSKPADHQSRNDARRRATVSFLTRGAPIDDIEITRDAVTQRWSRVDGNAVARSKVQSVHDLCRAAGGWSSTKVAAKALGVAQGTAKRLLEQCQQAGLIAQRRGPRGAIAWFPYVSIQPHLPSPEKGGGTWQ